MDIQRGLRDKLEKYVDTHSELEVEMNVAGGATYDYCCFGVDGNNKLSDDRYMLFYNQTQSPKGEISYFSKGSGASFKLCLSKLPSSIDKLVFTVSIDGNGTMGDINSHSFTVIQNGKAAFEMRLSGSDFKAEKAIISMEVYKKETWRFAAVASGFNGGLGDLLRAYGGEEVSETKAEPIQSAGKVSLEKKLEAQAPELVSLAKPLKVTLENKNLQDTIARVALVLDISGSMRGRYNNGAVQDIVNKTLPLAVQFDDNGELDFWYYGNIPRRMEAVDMKNYKNAVPSDWKVLMRALGGGNNEPSVMKEVISEYEKSKLPAYILFITDGGVANKSTIKKLITESAKVPIFWQFVGVGGSNYGVLEELDTMEGRYVDNANFFALDDFKSVSNEELYSRLLEEFPQWLKDINAKGML